MDKEYKNRVINDENDDFCDIDPNKICDSCGKCLELDKNYKIIKITKIIENEDDI